MAAGRPWITALGTKHLARAIAEVGGDPAIVLARFGFPAAPRFEDRIELAAMIGAWEAAVEATGRRDLPAVAAPRAVHDEHSLVAFVTGNQPRLADGLVRMERYYPTVSNVYSWRYQVTADELVVTAAPSGPVDRLGWQLYLEFESLDIVWGGRRLVAGEPTAIRFMHARPDAAAVAAVAEVGGVEPAFSCPAYELRWSREILDRTVADAQPDIAKLVEDRLDAMLEAMAHNAELTARTRAAIGELLPTGRCDVPALARALRLSRRSLERALADEGTSAGELIEAERKQRALAWLPALSVDEVAARLGYSDARAFARAFKRWTGEAPSAYRAAATADRR
jgi:AraC-like DNA-binding protein